MIVWYFPGQVVTSRVEEREQQREREGGKTKKEKQRLTCGSYRWVVDVKYKI
jgi:hypothetical protein